MVTGNATILPFGRFYRERMWLSSLFLSSFTLLLDYLTGRWIQFPVFYVLPVGMLAWQRVRTIAYLFSLVLPLIRVGFHFLWNDPQPFGDVIVNATINTFALSCYAYLVDRIAWQTGKLEKKLRVLEGILPICAHCKKIRNQTGEYESVEKYITEHSDAEFSHGICPECFRKCYPEFEDAGNT